jgi:hypothetical protein
MLSRSFHVGPGRLVPRPGRCKPLLILLCLILAGCGGSSRPKAQAVHGSGFSFSAPVGWKVAVSKASAGASQDGGLVQVTVFPLLRAYTDSLFAKVGGELGERMQAVAKQLHGSLGAATTTTVAGIRSHGYTVTGGGDVLQYTFVLRGKREYQLVCRRPAKAGASACSQLLTTFVPA